MFTTKAMRIQRSIDQALKRAEELERLANLLGEEDNVEDKWDVLPTGTDEEEWSTYILRLCNMEDR